jgi:hypothetical protein
VFLREGGVPRGLFRLLAIDHTHVIRQDGELTVLCLNIDRERDDAVYGLFPEFVNRIAREDLDPFVEWLQRLAQTNESTTWYTGPQSSGFPMAKYGKTSQASSSAVRCTSRPTSKAG